MPNKSEFLSILQAAWRKAFDAHNLSRAYELSYMYLLVIEGELDFLFE